LNDPADCRNHESDEEEQKERFHRPDECGAEPYQKKEAGETNQDGTDYRNDESNHNPFEVGHRRRAISTLELTGEAQRSFGILLTVCHP
jgi:hypothetical protein